MAIPSFFKQNKPRGFNYTPRYYDPVKEEREERRRALGKDPLEDKGTMEQGKVQKSYRSGIRRGSMRGMLLQRRQAAEKSSTIRLIVILLILTLIIYFYLRY